jgi:cytochrome c oxidase subunit II
MKKNSDLISKLLQKTSSMLTWSVALICMPWIQTSYASEPQPWQWNFQPPATPVMEQIIDFHNLMFFVEVGIVLLVLGLMVYIVVKFNSKANPKPTKTTHNTTLEVLWTVIPIVILIIFAVPSMKLLFFMEKAQNPEMTLKVTGNQWYWSYQYPDNGNFEFDSNIIPDEDIKPGQRRLLEVDNQVVLPVNTEIKVLLTARDVMHNWAVPAFGIKIDTIPGRINETWMKVTKIGTYYGQCSELCGVAHSRMPISVKVVSKEDFKKWLKKAKSEFASSDNNKMLKLAQLKKSK